jgi:hypothetical protein
MGQVVAVGVTIAVFAMVMLGWPSERHLALFGERYAVPVTDGNRWILGFAIWWSRLWRLLGTLAAFGALALAGVWTEVDVHPLLTAGLGYGLGAAVGELTRPRPGVASPRAMLARRGITDYVRPWVCALLGAVTVAALASTVSFLVVLRSTDAAARRLLDASGPATALLGAAAIVVAGASVASAHGLARRPQPVDALEREAAQHAIRSASIVSLLGGALLLVGTATVVAASGVVLIDGDLAEPIRWAHGLLLYLGIGGAVTGFFLGVRAIPRFGRPHGRVAVAA